MQPNYVVPLIYLNWHVVPFFSITLLKGAYDLWEKYYEYNITEGSI